jgi:hypothetical protein
MAAIVIVGGIISAVGAVVAYLDRKSLKAKLEAAELKISAAVRHDSSAVVAAVDARERLVRAEVSAIVKGAIIAAEQEAEKVDGAAKAEVVKIIGLLKGWLGKIVVK